MFRAFFIYLNKHNWPFERKIPAKICLQTLYNMADGLKMILAMALFFGAMYLYSWMPEILEARREKKREKRKLQKLADREAEKIELQKLREEKFQSVEERRLKIKEQFKWLDGMNEKINQIKEK